MAAPNTPVLDTFNRPNEDPLSSGGLWSGPIVTGHLRNRILSNQGAPDPTGATDTNYIATGTFLADQEAYITVDTLPEASTGLALWIRITAPNTGSAAAILGSYDTGVGFKLWDMTSGGASFVQLGATVVSSIAAGDKLWVSAIGTTIKFYRYTGGVWVEIMSRTSTINVAGAIGWGTSGDDVRAENFGGGEPADYVFPPIPPLGRGASW